MVRDEDQGSMPPNALSATVKDFLPELLWLVEGEQLQKLKAGQTVCS